MKWLQRLFGGGLTYRGTDCSACASCEVNRKFIEIVMAVERKFPGEARHETALRYVREREIEARQAGRECQQNAAAHPRAAQGETL